MQASLCECPLLLYCLESPQADPFPLDLPSFANQMYVALNPRFAGLLLGCLASLFVPIPLLLLKYGPKLRAMSKNSAKRP